MKKLGRFSTILLSAIIMLFIYSTNSSAKSHGDTKTDYNVKAKIIGVADPNYNEYTYVDVGKAQGITQGERFMVQGRYGKVMVEVVEVFQRMSAVKIVDSWLLKNGNGGKMISASLYPKARIRKFKEKKIMYSNQKAAKKNKAASSVAVKAQVVLPPPPSTNNNTNQSTVPALPGEAAMSPGNVEAPGVEAAPAMPGEAAAPEAGNGLPGEAAPGVEAAPAMPGEAAAPAAGSGLPGEEVPGGDMGAAPGAEPAGLDYIEIVPDR